MTISEYDGPTAWADMTAVEKMEAWLRGDVAECDEREVFKQAIREARSDAAVMTAISAELRESQAEVARLRAARVLPDCIKVEVPKGDPSSAFVAIMKDGGVHIGGWYRRNSDEISERLLWRLANAIALEPTR